MSNQDQGYENTHQKHPSCIEKIFPSVEDCRVKNMIKCTEEGCSSTFTAESNFTLHLIKSHNRGNLVQANPKQYHCPAIECIYNDKKYFKNMKYLRQHYLKVHSEKKFPCATCKKTFPSEVFLKMHVDYCGISFKCCNCEEFYESYETLRTHGRRKKHKILTKLEYKPKISILEKPENIVTFKPILPKNINVIILPNDKSTCDQESQTVDGKSKFIRKMTGVKNTEMCQISQQTQTGNKNDQFSVETQTIGDFVNTNRKNVDLLLDSLNQKDSKTQTDTVESRTTSCNTSFSLNDFEFSDVETNSSSTQTIYSASVRNCDSIHTDTSDLLVSNSLNSPINNFEFDNCHMETQTDFKLEDEMFSCDYYSNMYTQTCDDILNQFGFSDIQTQTVFDDMLRSVESQTMMSHIVKGNLGCKDTSHMETQTDAEFRQMLEVINS